MIEPADIAARVSDMMPGQEPVTLSIRQSNETFVTSSEQARQKPANLDTVALVGGDLGQTWTWFQFYGPSQTPLVGGKVTEQVGTVHEIKRVEAKMRRTIFSCLCVRDK